MPRSRPTRRRSRPLSAKLPTRSRGAARSTTRSPPGSASRRRPPTPIVLTEARYRDGIDTFLTVLDAQRSYYSAQQVLVQTKLTAAQNIVDLYQAIGGDALLQGTPVCQPLPGDTGKRSMSGNACRRPEP